MTSSDVVVTVRRRLGKKTKVGHAGTLDPEACGVLPIMVGKASRLFSYLVDKEKTYIAQFKPGCVTDTQDAQGKVISSTGRGVSREELESALPHFLGTIMQVPPMFSAIKRNGKKLYELAREGKHIEVEPREAQIHELRVLRALDDGSYLLKVVCGRGTYVRTLCQDIGEFIGCGAHMGYLLRTHTGDFDIEDACTIEQIKDEELDLSALFVRIDAPIEHLPCVHVHESAARFLLCGNPLFAHQLDCIPELNVPLRVYLNEKFAGIGRFDGNQLSFDAMLLER